MEELNEYINIKFLALDCKPIVYEKVYSAYGFKKIMENTDRLSCGMNIDKI